MCFLFTDILETTTEVSILEEKSVCLRCEIRTKIAKIVYTFILWNTFKKQFICEVPVWSIWLGV